MGSVGDSRQSRFEVDALEVERGGASYSVDTLRTIGERIAPEKPVFTIGQDAFVEIDSWREPEALFDLAHFAVITRPPVALASLADWLPRCIRNIVEPDQGGVFALYHRAGTWIRLVEIPALDISSSDIRIRLRDGESVRYLLPPTSKRPSRRVAPIAMSKTSAADECLGSTRQGGVDR